MAPPQEQTQKQEIEPPAQQQVQEAVQQAVQERPAPISTPKTIPAPKRVSSASSATVLAYWPVLVGMILAIGAVAVYKQKGTRHDAGLTQLCRFIDASIAKGHSFPDIQQTLLSHGWPLALVEQGFAAKGMRIGSFEIRKPVQLTTDHPHDPLREYIGKMAEEGMSALIIRDHLMKAGWDPSVIQPIIDAALKR